MPKESSRPIIFSALEVANICGVVNQTAINWIRNGHLRAFSTPGGQYRVYADDLINFMTERGMRVPATLLTDAGVPYIDKHAVLIVDDDHGLNTVISKYLTKTFSDFNIYQSFDGFDAGAQIIEKKPGFIILDLDIPGINAKSILHRLKETEDFGKPYVIIIISSDDEEIRSSLTDVGADMFIKKPINLSELSNYINKIISI